ncbi:MAG: polysaccharide biosynthesis/export family protein [Terracidiphilus sp.]
MPDTPAVQHDMPRSSDAKWQAGATQQSSSTSLRELWAVLVRRRRFVESVIGGLLVGCLLYCLLAPNQYEASARVALRAAPAISLSLDGSNDAASGSFASGQIQLETLANVFRSDQLAWRVISSQKLYQAPAFMGSFGRRFPGFRPDAPGPEAQAYLLERFQRRLTVQTLPRTLILQIRFRSKDPALSARVVNELIRAYNQQDTELRVEDTTEATAWLNGQLQALKARVDKDDQRLLEFQKEHGLFATPETLANGQLGDVQHTTAFIENDELGKQLVAATADRILREAEYRAASRGDPELVLASDPRLQSGNSSFATALLQQLHGRQSELEQEEAQLRIEHGPNFPRVVEIRGQLQDLDGQVKAEDARLIARFHAAFATAADRELLVRQSLDQSTGEGMKLNESATQYAVMSQEANRSHELYMRVMEKAEEAGLSAGVQRSNISVVDEAHQPVKPVAPDLPVYMAITLFAGIWLAVGGALLLESFRPLAGRSTGAVLVLALALIGAAAHAQAPTPSTSGLPTGVARIPQSTETKSQPNAKTAPTVWSTSRGAREVGVPSALASQPAMPAPIAPGDLLEVTEYHTPEFHSSVRVSESGTVTLPLAGEVQVGGLDEQAAAHSIESALIARGMLLHPQVTVLVTAYVGQDVSVLGEVTHPGVYPLAQHHRLLDLLSAASGLAPGAGSLVTIVHRNDPNAPSAVVLDPAGIDTATDHNPELDAGDTVQVSRAGLVYVVGDVMRPGGFPVDPVQKLTVVQALTLAWGPTQNASLGKALLIREQKGGRTLTTLNLKRLLRGQDPDLPIQDRDIIFVPDSTARNLWNRSMESVIQSAAGVSIYAGLVYSQRF